MLNVVDEQKIKEVFSDEAFVKSLLNMECAEEVQTAIAEKGIELTVADIEMLRGLLAHTGEEISEEELENVAGGFVIPAIVITIGSCCGALFSVGAFVNNVTERRW